MAVREGDTVSTNPPAENQQVTRHVRLRCVTGMCRNVTVISLRGQIRNTIDIGHARFAANLCVSHERQDARESP
jgi:hypothetical protein